MIFSRNSHRLLLLLILALALLSRAGSFAYVYRQDPTRIIRQDSPTYELPARALLQTGRFAVNPGQPTLPETQRTPGYPAFIALVYALFGVRHPPLILIQILLSIVTIGLIDWIGRRLLDAPRAALCAAALVLLEPATFLHSQLLLSETLFALLVLLLAAAGLRMLREPQARTRWAFLVGLLIAVSALVRPINYFFIFPVLLGTLLVRLIQKSPPRLLVRSAAAMLLPWLVLAGGWQLRNKQAIGHYAFSTIQGVNLYLYRGAGIVALRDHLPFEAAQQKLLREIDLKQGTPPGQIYEAFSREGSRLIRAYPLLFLRTQAAGLQCTLFGISGGALQEYFGLGQTGADPPPRHNAAALMLTLYSLAALALLYFGLLAAPWRALLADRQRLPLHLFLIGTVLYQALLSAGPESNSRFRVPFLPLLALYSGLGLVRAYDGLATRILKIKIK